MPILGAIFSFAANIPKNLAMFNFLREHMGDRAKSKDLKGSTSNPQMTAD